MWPLERQEKQVSSSPNHNPVNNLKYIISKYDLNYNKKSIMYESYQNDYKLKLLVTHFS